MVDLVPPSLYSPATDAASLKQLRALVNAERHLANVVRGRLETATEHLMGASRELHNLLHAVHPVTMEVGTSWTTLRFPSVIPQCHEPSAPPFRLRAVLGAYGALITVLRRQPIALAELLHHSQATPATGIPLVLCGVWGHLTRS